jgi:8-oxo-dGTP pyrophosphatase MutT (NUDIX family)
MNTNYLLKGMPLDSNRVAKVVIFDEDFSILILETDNNPQFEGQWDLPGGHVMINENIIDGLIREVWEETGLIIINPEELYKKETTTFFTAELPKGDIRLSSEHKNYKFVPLESLDDYKISDKFRDVIRRAHE